MAHLTQAEARALGIGSKPTAQKAKRERMNKTEAAYWHLLAHKKRVGELMDFEFEAITLRLGADLRYTPDFAVWANDGSLEFHETKGFMRDDARVKLRSAASKYAGRHKFYIAKTASRRDPRFTVTEVPT